MQYSKKEYWRNTRHGLYAVFVLTLIGLFLIWFFYQSVKPKSLIYEGPSSSAARENDLPGAEKEIS